MNAKALFGRAFQVAFSSATNLVARNQMQPVGIYDLFVAEQGSQVAPSVKKY